MFFPTTAASVISYIEVSFVETPSSSAVAVPDDGLSTNSGLPYCPIDLSLTQPHLGSVSSWITPSPTWIESIVAPVAAVETSWIT